MSLAAGPPNLEEPPLLEIRDTGSRCNAARSVGPRRVVHDVGQYVLALMLVNGCSWIGVSPPPHTNVAIDKPACTESVGAPIVDTAAAAAYATLAVASLVGLGQHSSVDCPNPDDFCPDIDFSGAYVATAIVGGIGTALHTASAVYGYSTTARCRAARDKWELRAPQRSVEPEGIGGMR
jgi:hypothetical protein